MTGEVVEPTAKRLVEKGVLSAYSIGISHPKVVTDARAPGGRICGGDIVEVSLVDRPANPSCKFALAKGAISGEWVGEIEQIDETDLNQITNDLAEETKAAEAEIVKNELESSTQDELENTDSDMSELDKFNQAVELIKGSRVFYTNDHKDSIQKAMGELHDSLAAAFPEVCNSVTKSEDETVVVKADDSEDEEKNKKDAEDEAAADDNEDADDDEDEGKTVESEVSKSEPAVEEEPKEEAVSMKAITSELKKLRKQNKKLAAEQDRIQKQYDALASEPDPAQAAVRGAIPAPVQKVASPVDGAQKRAAEQERADRIAWLRDMALGGEPNKMSWAQGRLAELGEDYV